MQPRTLKKFFPFLIKTGLILCSTQALASGGGDWCDYEDACRSFFDPESIQRPEEIPFFYTEARRLYGESANDITYQIPTTVIAEWSEHFKKKLSDDQLKELVFKMPLPELDQLIFSLQGKPAKLSAFSQDLRKALDKSAIPALFYLGFAKRVEPLATAARLENAWDAPKETPTPAPIDALLNAAKKQLTAVKDPFLREKYHHQIMSLLFYGNRQPEAEAYYKENFGQFQSKRLAKYRFLSLAAGAMAKQKKTADANYLYSRVYDESPELKASAYASFRPIQDEDWQATLKLARNPREVAVLWQMVGIRSGGAEAFSRIYAIDPKSELLPLLLVREVNRSETVREWEGTCGEAMKYARPADKTFIDESKLAVIRKITDEGKTSNPDLWRLALANLMIMQGDLATGEKYLKQVSTNKALADQLRKTKLYLKAEQLRLAKSVTPAEEEAIASELEWLQSRRPEPRSEAMRLWMSGVLRGVLKTREPSSVRDEMRGLLLCDEPANTFYRDVKKIDSLLAFMTATPKSKMDQYLRSTSQYDVNELKRMKGIVLIFNDRIAEGAAVLKGVNFEKLSPVNADPFKTRITDCFECDHVTNGEMRVPLQSIAQRLGELSGKASKSPEAAFELATGLYNITYYGNASDFYVTNRQNYPYGTVRAPEDRSPDLAEKYYDLARKLSKSREFQAKACYMGAKAEQKKAFDRNEKLSDSGNSPVHFELLKKEYADTKYYQEIIGECGYFKNWLGN